MMSGNKIIKIRLAPCEVLNGKLFTSIEQMIPTSKELKPENIKISGMSFLENLYTLVREDLSLDNFNKNKYVQ